MVQELLGRFRSPKFVPILGLSIALVLSFLVVSRLFLTSNIALGWDGPILVDGAYRVFKGQIPHVDFSAPMGPILFMFGGLGMWLVGPTILGLNLGLIIFGVLTIGLGITLLYKKLSPLNLILFSLLLGGIALTPRVLAYPSGFLMYVGQYNTFSYAMLLVVISVLYVKPCMLDIKEGLILTSLMLFMGLTKSTFGIAALILICLACGGKRFYLGCFIAFFLGLSVFLWAIGFDIGPVIRDQIFTITARASSGNAGLETLLKFIKDDYFSLSYLVIFLALTLSTIFCFTKKNVTLLVTCLALDIFFAVTIMQPPEHVILIFLLFVFLANHEELKFVNTQRAIKFIETRIGLLIVKYLSWVTQFISALIILNFTYQNVEAMIKNPFLSSKIEKVAISKYILPEISPMVEKHYLKGDGIITIGKNNIYNFYYSANPVKGVPLYWHKEVTFNKNIIISSPYFDSEKIFKDVDLIYLCTLPGCKESTVKDFFDSYGQYIESNFHIIDEKVGEILFRRNYPKAIIVPKNIPIKEFRN